MSEIIFSRYAKALFEICIQNNSIDKVCFYVEKLYNIFCSNKKFAQIINHPEILKKTKLQMISKVFSDDLPNELYGMIDILFNKNRYSQLAFVMDKFLQMVAEYRGVVTANIKTSTTLSQQHIRALKDILSKKFDKEVDLDIQIDETLIGGICIEVDGKLIDATIKKQLEDLKNNLHKIEFV